LTDFRKIGTRESVSVLGEESEVDTLGDGRAFESSLENRDTGSFVGLFEGSRSDTEKERKIGGTAWMKNSREGCR
jgi:hypothetical protein